MKKAIYALLVALALTLTLTSSAARRQDNAPDKSIRRHERSVPDSYIVVLKPEVEGARVAALAKSLAAAHGGRVAAVYQSALRGFSVQLTAKSAEALAHNPVVDYVEEDAIVEMASTTQTSAPWGLDRIDQTSLPLSTTYTYNATGAGVHAYIIDSGIRTTHQEFGSRASVSFDNVGDTQNGQDCFGHGTQLAGIVGGTTYGVAKGVSLHAVRVFSCTNGSTLTKIIGGIDWVAANHQSPSVALLSFSTSGSSSLDTAVNSLITSGVTTVVAAGNNNLDAGTRSPARVAAAITVGSVDQFDTRGVISNFGASLDLFAPGVDIPGADWSSDTATINNGTGTSYAAAHAAGVAAMYLETHPFFSTPAQVSQALVDRATTGVVINPGAGSPNRLLHLTEQSQAGTAITATKTDSYFGSPSPASPGQLITYSVTISNTDTFDATHVVFNDTVDPNTTIVPGSSSAPNTTVSGDTLTVNVGTIPAGQSVNFTFQVTVDNPYAGGPDVSNQGAVTADGSVNVLTDDPDFTGTTNPTLTPIGSQIRVNDARQAEPPSGTSQMLFVVTLTAPAPGGGLTVNYATANGGGNPATGGATCDGVSDYVSASGTLSVTAGSRAATIPVTVCADSNTTETDETFLLNISSPSSGNITDSQAVGTITTANAGGVFTISELRSRGPAGAGDDFVELYNNTTSQLTVAASDSSGGYGVYKMGSDCNATPVLVATIPNGTVMPARAHYLVRGSAYSLSNYGGTNAAAGDLTMTSDIEDDRNVAVFSTANVVNISSANRLDAVGFGSNAGGVCDLMREGSNIPPVGALNIEYSYFRKECDFAGVCTASGYPKDTNNNSVDFMFADTAITNISGVPQKLGAPGPQNLASPLRRDDSGVGLPLLDGTVSSASMPNRERDFTPNGSTAPNGTLYVRRRVQNSTGSTLTKLRFRVVEFTTGPTTPTGIADLRLVTSPTVTLSVNDPTTCASTGTPTTAPCTVTAQSTVLETPPTQSQGGGYNSTVTVAIPGGLASGASVDVNFALGVVQGGSFRFLVIIEALP
jgi:uncharacterized repeat protein (TIGR01451 family)